MTLAIGIGALTSMYGLMNALLFQPPPHVAGPDHVKRLFFHYQEPGDEPFTTARWYACVTDRLRAEAVTIQHAAAYSRFDVSVGSGADAARARVAVVSGGFWPALGTRPALGRVFTADEAAPLAGPRLVILSHAFWQQRYGGTSGVIGRSLSIRGEPFEIIGVAPRGFRGIEPYDVDLWLPLSSYTLSGRQWETDTTLSHVVRLKPEVTAAQADAELSRLLSDVVDEEAGCTRTLAATPGARLTVTVGPLVSGLGGDMRWTAEARVAIWLVGVGLGLAGVACANIVGLLHLRALRRRREIAVRLALGATSRRLMTQFFIEGALLAALGGLIAIAVVVWGGASLNRLLLPSLAVEPVVLLEPSMLLLTVAGMFGTAVIAGLVPMLHVPAAPLGAIRDGGSSSTGRRGRLHRLPLVVQTALSLVLLEDAGPCTRVVGVVENARRFFLREPAALLFYRPLSRHADDGDRALFVRIATGDRNTRAAVTRALQAMEPDLPFIRTQMLGDALDPQTRPWRLGVAIFTAFGAIALLLAALGLYGALSYSVTQRTREIGVRVAIGARRRDVVRLVVADSLRVAIAGIIAGTAISLVGGRWIANLLFDVSPNDPGVIAVVSTTLIVTALIAALVPSWRAARVDPVTALRAD